MRTKRAAVVDMGSNSIKWIAGEVQGNQIQVLQEESHPTRLAADLIHTGVLSEEAIERTLEVLRHIHESVKRLNVDQSLAVATSAVRDSRNRKDFIRRAKSALGFSVAVLSGDEEAETIFSGVASDPYWKQRDLFVVDIGGGSAEWIQGKGLAIERRMSLPLGCVRIKERFIKRFPVGERGMHRMIESVSDQLRPALANYQLAGRILVGTGGTATCLSAIRQEIPDFDPWKVDHDRVRRSDLMVMVARLQKMKFSELKKVVGLPPKRTDLILPGAAVLLATMDLLGAKEIRASVRGLRYGVLYRLLKST